MSLAVAAADWIVDCMSDNKMATDFDPFEKQELVTALSTVSVFYVNGLF